MLSYINILCDFSSTLGVFILVLAIYYWYHRPKNFPSGPRGLPLVGVIPFIGSYPERTVKKWSAKYGNIMSVRMGREDWVFLNDYESIHQALTKHPTKLSGRPNVPLFGIASEGNGIGLIDYSPKWKSQRKFGVSALRSLGFGKRSMESKVVEEIQCFNKVLQAKDGKAFDISAGIHEAVANVISSVVFGKRFEYEDPKLARIIKAITMSDDPTLNTVLTFFSYAPVLEHIPPFSKYSKYIKDEIKSILDLMDELVQQHKDTFDKNNIGDFTDAFIDEMNKNEDPSFTNKQLLFYVFNLFTAGIETTGGTMYWIFLTLLHYPQSQSKLREEVIKVIGTDGIVSGSHRSGMPYTCAFIQEIMRYRTLVPLNVPHKANEDTELNGYFIPKETAISTNLWAVHNDPELWDEPEKFKPERFIDEKGNFFPSNHVIPFSIGPRRCLGEQLARMEVFIFLVGMIQKFEFLPDPSADQLPEIEKFSNGFVAHALRYKLVAKEL